MVGADPGPVVFMVAGAVPGGRNSQDFAIGCLSLRDSLLGDHGAVVVDADLQGSEWKNFDWLVSIFAGKSYAGGRSALRNRQVHLAACDSCLACSGCLSATVKVSNQTLRFLESLHRSLTFPQTALGSPGSLLSLHVAE